MKEYKIPFFLNLFSLKGKVIFTDDDLISFQKAIHTDLREELQAALDMIDKLKEENLQIKALHDECAHQLESVNSLYDILYKEYEEYKSTHQ